MMNNDKALLRKEYQARLDGMSPALRNEASARIRSLLREWLLAQSCERLVAFWPMAVEPELGPLFAELAGRLELAFVRTLPGPDPRLAVHRWSGGAEEFEDHPRLPLRQIKASAELLDGPALAAAARRTVVLVPGLAFSAGGARLGRGKGYYDRWLSENPGCLRLGIGFACQIAPDLPCEPHDAVLDFLLTETGTLRCPQREAPPPG